MTDDLYFEDYVGQDTTGFEYIGVIGKDPVPLTDAEEQVKEFIRLFGDSLVRIYKHREMINA